MPDWHLTPEQVFRYISCGDGDVPDIGSSITFEVPGLRKRYGTFEGIGERISGGWGVACRQNDSFVVYVVHPYYVKWPTEKVSLDYEVPAFTLTV